MKNLLFFGVIILAMNLSSCCKQQAIEVTITSIKVLQFEEQDHEGEVWDEIGIGSTTLPDIFVRAASNGASLEESDVVGDAAVGEYNFEDFNWTITLDEFNESFDLQLLDQDAFDNALMGSVSFSVEEDFGCKETVVLENDKVAFELSLTWVEE